MWSFFSKPLGIFSLFYKKSIIIQLVVLSWGVKITLYKAPVHRHIASVQSHFLGLISQIPGTFSCRPQILPITHSALIYSKQLQLSKIICLLIYCLSFVKKVSFRDQGPYLSALLLCLQCLEWCLIHIVTLDKYSFLWISKWKNKQINDIIIY